MGGFGDLGRGVVADFGGEGGDEHQGIVDVVFDLRGVDFDSLDTVGYETVHGVGEEFDAVEIVEDDDGLEYVQLEIALRAGETDGSVVAHHLDGDHGERFGLRGIYFAGHDAGAGLVFGKNEFAEAAARAGSEPANVVGDFHQRCGEGFQRAAGEDEFIVRAERGEFIGMRAEWQAGKFSDFFRGALGKFGMRVEAGADRRAANRKIVESIERDRDARAVAIELKPNRKIPARR